MNNFCPYCGTELTQQGAEVDIRMLKKYLHYLKQELDTYLNGVHYHKIASFGLNCVICIEITPCKNSKDADIIDIFPEEEKHWKGVIKDNFSIAIHAGGFSVYKSHWRVEWTLDCAYRDAIDIIAELLHNKSAQQAEEVEP